MMKKSKGSIIFLFLLMVSFIGNAQNDWRQGYIIGISKDTIHGYLDYRSPKSNSQQCYFKEKKTDASKKYTAREIIGYKYVDGEYYTSKKIKIKQNEHIVFLEYLIKGKVSLYFYKGDDEKYFTEKGGQLYELKNSKSIQNRNDRDYVKEKREYIGTLSYLFQEANIKKYIDEKKLDSKSLINTIKKYYSEVCVANDCIDYEKKINRAKVKFGLIYGKNHKTLHFDEYQNFELKPMLSDYYGVTIHFHNIPSIYDRISFQLELLAYEFIYKENKQHLINVPFLVDYKLLSRKKIEPKIEIGISFFYSPNLPLISQHFTLIGGLSLHYNFFKDYRFFINTRLESNPRMLRFSAGVIF